MSKGTEVSIYEEYEALLKKKTKATFNIWKCFWYGCQNYINLNYSYHGNIDILIENVKVNITYEKQNLVTIQRESVGFLKGVTEKGNLVTMFDAKIETVSPLMLQQMTEELTRTGKLNFPLDMDIQVRYISIRHKFPLSFNIEAKPT
eukprot:gene9198-1284_t